MGGLSGAGLLAIVSSSLTPVLWEWLRSDGDPVTVQSLNTEVRTVLGRRRERRESVTLQEKVRGDWLRWLLLWLTEVNTKFLWYRHIVTLVGNARAGAEDLCLEFEQTLSFVIFEGFISLWTNSILKSSFSILAEKSFYHVSDQPSQKWWWERRWPTNIFQMMVTWLYPILCRYNSSRRFQSTEYFN